MQYDPSRDALYHPANSDTVFQEGVGLPPSAVCAELSRLAYVRFDLDTDATRGRLDRALARAGLAPASTFANPATSAEAFATRSHDGQQAFLAFRGTQSDDPTDLASDADVQPVPWLKGGKVHRGFAAVLDSIWPRIDAWLTANPAAQVWFTGHSLGAALATLAFSRAGRGDARLVTFGSPRVGDRVFAATIDAGAVERYVNCCDLVTELPPQFLDYAHIDPCIYIDRDGNVRMPPLGDSAISDDRSLARRTYLTELAWRRGNLAVRDLADHAPVNYIRAFFK